MIELDIEVTNNAAPIQSTFLMVCRRYHLLCEVDQNESNKTILMLANGKKK